MQLKKTVKMGNKTFKEKEEKFEKLLVIIGDDDLIESYASLKNDFSDAIEKAILDVTALSKLLDSEKLKCQLLKDKINVIKELCYG